MRGLFGHMAAPVVVRFDFRRRAELWNDSAIGQRPIGVGPVGVAGHRDVGQRDLCRGDDQAKDVARCVPTLYTINPDGTRLALRDHPVAKLLKRPNRVQTWFEFARDWTIAYLLRGNGYAVILRDYRGNPVELLLVNPDAVMVLESSDGQWFYNVNRIGLFQIAMLRDFPVAIPAEDVMVLRGPELQHACRRQHYRPGA